MKPALGPDPGLCPRCRKALHRYPAELGMLFGCEGCRGAWLSVTLLQRLYRPVAINAFWRGLVASRRYGGLTCPSCGGSMLRAPASAAPGAPALDGCVGCHLVWFDERELDVWARKTEAELGAMLTEESAQAAANRARVSAAGAVIDLEWSPWGSFKHGVAWRAGGLAVNFGLATLFGEDGQDAD